MKTDSGELNKDDTDICCWIQNNREVEYEETNCEQRVKVGCQQKFKNIQYIKMEGGYWESHR